ncbi:terminase large subunit [Zavarzinella formosa]|uniref:terminase large subunit n=1 Tax=Zavarzinella formosa TaxID=360055 RepID=UPI0002FE1A64|nr:terminase TerL endonuclease subunit [Zavarzinella formosa]
MNKPDYDPSHPTTQYARDVVEGKIVAGKWVKLACQRHLDDLENAHERGLWFDERAATAVFRFFALLRLAKGKWAGKPFKLEPWQKFVLGCAYGWKREDGLRRFREVHLEVARKNGKTEVAAGNSLYLLVVDGEQGGEVYFAATKKEQAEIAFDAAAKMAAKSPILVGRVKVYAGSLVHAASGSKAIPLGADAKTQDGLNPSGISRDELHQWKGRDFWDVLETATGARSQPLGLSITTAGHNKFSIWWERRERCLMMLSKKLDDDELLALIYTLDEGDDWTDLANYIKANPNLGVTVRIEELAKRCEQAKQTPGAVNAFKRLRLNIPTDSAERWIDEEQWAKCRDPIDEAELRGRKCFAALDLSQTLDLTALGLIFPPTGADLRWRYIVRHFLPKDVVRQRSEKDRVPYDQWAAEGLLILTEGNCVDYAAIKLRVIADALVFQIVALAYDRMFALPVIQELQDEGIECIPWGQGYLSMNAPTKELSRQIASGELAHQGDKVLDWEAGNVCIETDAAGNVKPSKRRSGEKIDGFAAMCSGLGVALLKNHEAPTTAGMLEMDEELASMLWGDS